MISAVDWRNDGLCSICLAARRAPSVGLLFLAGVIGNNTASAGLGKQAACGFACLLAGTDSGREVAGLTGHTGHGFGRWRLAFCWIGAVSWRRVRVLLKWRGPSVIACRRPQRHPRVCLARRSPSRLPLWSCRRRRSCCGGEHGFAALAVGDRSLVWSHPLAGNGFIRRLDDLALAALRGHRVVRRDRAAVCCGSV